MEHLQALVLARRLAGSPQPRRLREQAGLSLVEVAEVIGVDATTLCRWELGLARPRTEAALRWLQALVAIQQALTTSRTELES